MPRLPCCVFCVGQGSLWQSSQFLLGDLPGPGIGGVQNVFAEGATQRRQALADFAIPLFFIRWQRNTGQSKIAQCVLDCFALGGAQRGKVLAIGNLLIGSTKARMLAHPGTVGRELRETGIVGLT